MKVYKHYLFAKWMSKIRLTDGELMQAIDEIDRGLVDASLGNGIIKKRVAVNGKGKRGAVRTIIAFQVAHRAIFIYGFAKNKRANISKNETMYLKQLAKVYLGFNEQQLKKAIQIGELIEVI